MFDPRKQEGYVVWSSSMEPIEMEHLYRYKLDILRSEDAEASDEADALTTILEACKGVEAEPRCILRVSEPEKAVKATYHGIGRLREPVSQGVARG